MRLDRGSWLPTLVAFAFLLIGISVSSAKVPNPAFPKADALNNLQKLRTGKINVKDKPEYANALADFASWMADRLDNEPFNGENLKSYPKENIDTLLEEMERYTGSRLIPSSNVDEMNNQIDNIRVFAEKMDERIQYVMKETTKRLVRVNAARMLAMVGRLPTDALVNTFLKMIKEPAYPIEVKLYIFQGLGNVLSALDPKDPTRGVIQDPDKLGEVCKVLETFITAANPGPKAPPESSIYQDWVQLVQYIRREAIRALAQVKYSVVKNRQRQPIARPIWTLVRVLRHDPRNEKDQDISPAFSESEQLEAMIGICQMRPDDLVSLDVLAWAMSDALMELSAYHNDQKAQFQRNPRFKPAIAWKLYGYRLSEAMKQWKTNVASLPATRNPQAVIKLVDAATTRFIARMEADGIAAVPDAQPLVTWKSTGKPKSGQVFTDDASMAIKLE